MKVLTPLVNEGAHTHTPSLRISYKKNSGEYLWVGEYLCEKGEDLREKKGGSHSLTHSGNGEPSGYEPRGYVFKNVQSDAFQSDALRSGKKLGVKKERLFFDGPQRKKFRFHPGFKSSMITAVSVSVIIPCLNEEGSISECVRLVKEAFSGEPNLEILVVDNGSTDQSQKLAISAGARVIMERKQGYGAAILSGLREAKGEYLVVGDADNTYDFRDGALLVEELKKGAEFAIGDRIHGQVDKGAMPWLHQHLGTPILTWVLNQFFGSRVHDINCGLRAIRKSSLEKMRLRSPGMEFASEMVIHAQKAGLKFAEVPVRYYCRHFGQVKLRTFRDGWRHLRFILLCAPFPLFVIPSIGGTVLSGFLFAGERFGHQVIGSLVLIVSFEMLLFGIFAKAHLWILDSFILDRRFGKWIEKFQLEYGILVSFIIAFVGVIFFRFFDLSNLIRGVTMIAVSVQCFFSSFLLSMILFKRQN